MVFTFLFERQLLLSRFLFQLLLYKFIYVGVLHEIVYVFKDVILNSRHRVYLLPL